MSGSKCEMTSPKNTDNRAIGSLDSRGFLILSNSHDSSTSTAAGRSDLSQLIERVDAAVEKCRIKVNTERRNGALHIDSLIRLIEALDDKFCLRCRNEDREDCISLCREGLSLTAEDKSASLLSARLSILLSRALGAIEDRAEPIYRDHSHLEERIKLCRSALEVISKDSVYYLEALSELACALCQKPTPDRCQEALSLQARVQSQNRDAHPLNIRFLIDNVACHYALSYVSNNTGIAQQSATLACKSLDICPQAHFERYRACLHTSRALNTLFDLTTDVSLIRRDIELKEERLSIAQQTGQRVHTVYGAMCKSYRALHEATGSYEDLEHSVAYADLTLLHTPIDDKYRPTYVCYSCLLLLCKFNRFC
jgi:hypothetical protein